MLNKKTKTHLPAQFTRDINQLKQSVMDMGGVVEDYVSQIIRALAERDNSLLPDTKKLEKIVNTYEVDIDNDCVEILACRQPMASDLRTIVGIMKISANLERMGDEAEKIAKLIQLSSLDNIPQDVAKTIDHMGKQVLSMIPEAMDCFARLDSVAAQKLVEEDDEVDEEYGSSLHQLLAYAKQEPDAMRHVIHIIWVVRALERIADHAKNIAEYAIYVDKAVDVRHGISKDNP